LLIRNIEKEIYNKKMVRCIKDIYHKNSSQFIKINQVLQPSCIEVSCIEVVMPENISGVPSKSASALQEKALELIGSKSDGIYQSELRKQLGIESTKCSRIVSRLERSGTIKREPADFGCRRTYLIRLINEPLPEPLPKPLPEASPVCSVDANRNINTNINANLDTYRNIDTYLTEFYLLYLIRGSTGA
jgi:DNA-binding Lrp family transcriptional regulator